MKAGIAGIIVVVIAGVALFSFQHRLIFFPEVLPDGYVFSLPEGAEEVYFEASDGARLHGIHYRQEEPGRGVILYFHGNAGSLRSWQTVAPIMLSTGYDLFLMDYRGFGKSRGRLSEKGLYADGQAAYEVLRERGYGAEEIVILGRSIGTGIATEVARTRESRGLILETPFTSLPDLAGELMPWVPRFLVAYRFENLKKAGELDVPVLVVHGDRDEVIPLRMGREVYEALDPGRREFVLLEGATHNDITGHPRYREGLRGFLEGLDEL